MQRIEKLPTGIPGFDLIAAGGLPAGRSTLIAGTAGSGKTVLAAQFLAEGIRQYDEAGVFVTFEEAAADLRRNLGGFGWDIDDWEASGRWAFVDGAPRPDDEVLEAGAYDLGGLIARIEHAVRRTGARRVAIDSITAIFSQLSDGARVRRELYRVAAALPQLGVTAIMTAERTEDYGSIGRFQVEEFIADNVVILRNVLDEEKRRRTLEVLKFRGATHQRGEFPFTVIPGEGIVIFPLSAMELRQRSSDVRITSGNARLDRICGGGFFRDSVILVSGATGTGKTLTVTTFLAAAAARGERALLFAFEESREQLFRNATGWGFDFETHGGGGPAARRLRVPRGDHARGPAARDQDDRRGVPAAPHCRRQPVRPRTRRRRQGIPRVRHRPDLLHQAPGDRLHVHVDRGSMHDRDIREFRIDAGGMHIGRPFRNVTGILTGQPVYVQPGELERIEALFEEERA